jgi:Pvc16 N-terminal domain
MAVFTNLYDASDVLRYILDSQIAPANGVLVTAPPDTISTTEEIIVSLMWLTEQPTHRNDPPYRNYDGTMTPPPATLSVFYLITTYGEGPAKNADAAHRLLGEIVRIFHTQPVVTLPLAGLPGNSGVGDLEFRLVPMTPDVMEKILLPLQIEHRPFVVYEVGPVQLKSLLRPGPPTPVVAPGSIVLSGPAPTPRPVLSRLVPFIQAEGGILRLDGPFSAAVTAVIIGLTRIPQANITVIGSGNAVNVTLPTVGPDAVVPGVQNVKVETGNLQSDPVELLVVSAGQWALDGPPTLTHSQTAALVLTGQGLSNADMIYTWPESGIRAPTDVKTFVPSMVTATSITVMISGLMTGEYRVSARINLGQNVPAQFTPYVVLGITP